MKYSTHFVECAFFCDIFDNNIRKFLLRGIGVSVKDFLSLFFGSNCHYCLISNQGDQRQLNSTQVMTVGNYSTHPRCSKISMI